MTLGDELGWPGSTEDRLAILPRLCSSLAAQPPNSFVRRSWPLRWVVSLPTGTGDFAVIRERTPALWTGDTLTVLGDFPAFSPPGWLEDEWVVGVNGFSTDAETQLMQVVLADDICGSRSCLWTIPPGGPFYSKISWTGAPITFGLFEGEMNGPLILEPFPYWKAVDVEQP